MEPTASPATVGSAMAEAASAWLDGLDGDQTVRAQWTWPGSEAADAERVRWYYTPTDHGGLPLRGMGPRQQRDAMRLLSTGLSEAAYDTVCLIMGMEYIVDRDEGFRVTMGPDRVRDPGMYYLRVFGDPGGGGPWSWRFGGHHVSVHHLVVDGEAVAGSPCFLGATPMAVPVLGGRELRPLDACEQTARDLLDSLDGAQRARAVIAAVAPTDIVTGNRARVQPGDRPPGPTELWRGHSDQRIEDAIRAVEDARLAELGASERDRAAVVMSATPVGVLGSELGADQRALLRAVIETYVGRMPPGVAERERDLVMGTDAALDAVGFAWAGEPGPGRPHYYRLQGPQLLAEWDNAWIGAGHGHSVWRNPTRDFGGDVLAEHHRAHPHP